nr:hypothetical protein [Tanacetum cinerariifolium]
MDRYGAHDRLVAAYFSETPMYDEQTFRTRDCTGRVGISPLMKCTYAIRQLTYDIVPDALDEYLQMSAITAREDLVAFCVCWSNNGVNIIRQSPIFFDLKSGIAPDVPFLANDLTYKKGLIKKKKFEQGRWWFELILNIRARLVGRLGPVVVWMVFPRLDPGSTVLVDLGKPCTRRKPVKGGVFR